MDVPPNFLTPRRFPIESRLFLADPPPRLVDVRIWMKDAINVKGEDQSKKEKPAWRMGVRELAYRMRMGKVVDGTLSG